MYDKTFKCENKEWEEVATKNSEQHNNETLKGQKNIFAPLTKSNSILWSQMWLVRMKSCVMVSFYLFYQSLLWQRSKTNPIFCLNNQANIFCALWIMERKEVCMGQVASCACGPLFNIKQLLLPSVSPMSICHVILLAGQLLLSWACHFLFSLDMWWQLEA